MRRWVARPVAMAAPRTSDDRADDAFDAAVEGARPGRCVACGACDARFDAYGRVERHAVRAVSDVVLAAGRSGTATAASARRTAMLARGDVTALESVCPTGVPFRRLVEASEAHARPRSPSLVAGAARAVPAGAHDPG